MNKFTNLAHVAGGHSFWRAPDGRITVADDSSGGCDPRFTDDGVLYT